MGVGYVPGPYVDLINKIAVSAGAYDRDTAILIKASLSSARLVRRGGAYSPFAHLPLSFQLGSSLAALGGSVAPSAAIEAVTGKSVMADAGSSIPMYSTVHLVHVGAAYRFRLRADLVLRVSVEHTQPFASSSGITYTAKIAAAQSRVDAAPVIDVSLRWRPGGR